MTTCDRDERSRVIVNAAKEDTPVFDIQALRSMCLLDRKLGLLINVRRQIV